MPGAIALFPGVALDGWVGRPRMIGHFGELDLVGGKALSAQDWPVCGQAPAIPNRLRRKCVADLAAAREIARE